MLVVKSDDSSREAGQKEGLRKLLSHVTIKTY
jgi:hypothetical protein